MRFLLLLECNLSGAPTLDLISGASGINRHEKEDSCLMVMRLKATVLISRDHKAGGADVAGTSSSPWSTRVSHCMQPKTWV